MEGDGNWKQKWREGKGESQARTEVGRAQKSQAKDVNGEQKISNKIYVAVKLSDLINVTFCKRDVE